LRLPAGALLGSLTACITVEGLGILRAAWPPGVLEVALRRPVETFIRPLSGYSAGALFGASLTLAVLHPDATSGNTLVVHINQIRYEPWLLPRTQRVGRAPTRP
jgi:hypothetical protein